jgi:hypothetical protein
MSEDRRQRGKQAPARKKARGKAGKKRAEKAVHAAKIAKAPRKPRAAKTAARATKAVAKPAPAVVAAVHEVEVELEPMAAVRELEPVEWAREPADTASLFDSMGPEGQHSGYLTTGARRLVARVARAALAPFGLARAVLGRLRDHS